MDMHEQIAGIRTECLQALDKVSSLGELEQLRVAVLGKKGSLTGLLRGMGQVAKEERAAVGKAVNEVRGAVEAALEERKRALAAKALEAMEISLEDVRAQVIDIIGEGQETPSGHIPFTPRAKKVLEYALREGLQLGHSYIGTEHLLLGLLREQDGVAAGIERRFRQPFQHAARIGWIGDAGGFRAAE